MNIRVPDTLTAENSEKYILSIRLCPDGFSFAGYIPLSEDSFFYGETMMDQTKSYTEALEDIFKACPFFSYTYKKVYILSANLQYTLIPETIFLEKQTNELMSFVFSSSAEKVLHQLQKELDIEVAFSIYPEVYVFFCHKLVQPQFVHTIAPMLSLCRKRNLSCLQKQLYIATHEDIMDAVCFDKGVLLFANSFNYNNANDIVYYILYIWKQAAMDQMKDELFLYINTALFQELKEMLQNYLLKINMFESILSPVDRSIPLDVKALLECEL